MKSLIGSGIAVLAFTGVAAAAPTEVPLVPLEEFARAPAVVTIAVSPDGKRLAEVRTIDGRGSIVVRAVRGKQSRIVARNPDRSIDNAHWSPDGRFIFYFQDAGGDEGFHLFRVDPDADKPSAVDLTPYKGATADLIPRPYSRGSSVVVTINRRDPEWPDAYRLDIATGKLTEIQRNSGAITNYFANAEGSVVAAESIRPTGELQLLVPDSSRGWKSIYTAPANERFKTLLSDGPGRSVYARTNRGSDREQLVSIELASGRVGILPTPECAPFDVEDVGVSAGGLDAVR